MTISDPTGGDSSGTTGEALTWARVLLFVRAHGVAGFALIVALYAMGFFSRAQTFGCGV